MQTQLNRLIGKVVSNQIGTIKNRFENINRINEIELKIKYKKKSKDILDILELLAFLEQLAGQKVAFNPGNVTEKSQVFKLNDCNFRVNLRRKRALTFLKVVQSLFIAERKDANLIETNCLNLDQRSIQFKYRTLKLFRRYLLDSYNNVEANLLMTLSYNKKLLMQVEELTKYMFYFCKKNELSIKSERKEEKIDEIS